MHRFWSVFISRTREFWRDRGSLIWNLLLPLVLILGLGAIFGGEGQPSYRVGVMGQQDAYLNPPQVLLFSAVASQSYQDLAHAQGLVERHQLDMLLDLDLRRYWINENSHKGAILEELLVFRDPSFQRLALSGLEVRYLDWLVPGVLAMNIMFASLFGVGYAIVRYRKNGVLKRLAATPLRPVEFLLAHVASRLLVVLMVCGLIYWGLTLMLGLQRQGSLGLLLLLAVVGSLCMIALGLLVASRVQSEELASGSLNFLTWPMLMLSGVFFSLEAAPVWVQSLAQLLPLTHLVAAARLIMVEGAGWAGIQVQLMVLLLQALLFLALAAWGFRWLGQGR